MIRLNSSLRNKLDTHGEIKPNPMPMPVFITGAMRSGTTFLVNKLATHPQLLKIGVELNDAWTRIGGAPIKGKCEYRNSKDANSWYAYQMTNYINQFIFESKSLKRHVMRVLNKADTNLQRIQYDWDNIIPVNKSPHLMNKITYVYKLFPKAKMILVVRDIFGQSASLKHHFEKESSKIRYQPKSPYSCWSTYRKGQVNNLDLNCCYPPNFNTIPEMWIRLNRLALKEIQEIPREQYIVLTYRDFVEKHNEAMRGIFDFIDLLPKYRVNEGRIIERTARKYNTSTKGNPLSKWTKLLNQEEVKTIEQVIKENDWDYNYIIDTMERLKIP